MAMRHKAREIAFHLLFEADYRLEEFSSDVEGEMKRYVAVHGHLDAETRSFAVHLVSGVLRYRDSLDATISNSGSNWRLDRIGLVEKTLLRMATFELRDPDEKGEVQPVEIVIDEAIELAKIYGPDEAPAFINGVLDALAPRVPRQARDEREDGQMKKSADGTPSASSGLKAAHGELIVNLSNDEP